MALDLSGWAEGGRLLETKWSTWRVMSRMQRARIQISAHRSTIIEMAIGVAVIVILPVLLGFTGSVTNPLFFVLGFNDLIGQLTGSPLQTDIGWEIAASAALADPDVSGYAPLAQMGPLIGMETVENVPHIHPPPSLTLGLPLAFMPYSAWIGSWVVGMVIALGWTLRVMSVPVWLAYVLAIGLSLTRVGQFTLTTTYPLLALAIAVAWRYRSGTWLPGLSMALITASRGVGGILLLYPLARRQWRIIVVAVVTLIVLSGIAIVLEPAIFQGFLTEGRASIEYTISRPMTTPSAILDYVGLPGFLAVVAAFVVAGVSLWRGNALFWVLNWLSFAVMPIGWAHAYVMLLPLAVLVWRSGTLGMFLMLVPAISLTAFTLGVVVIWPIGLAMTGLALMICRIEDPEDPLVAWRARKALSRVS